MLASVGGRDALVASTSGCATEWWKGYTARSPEPYKALTGGMPKDRLLAAEPAEKGSDIGQVGVDASGRIAFMRRFWPIDGEAAVSAESVYLWGDDAVRVFHFARDFDLALRLAWVGRYALSGGRAVSYEVLEEKGWKLVSTYAYDALGRPSCVANPSLGDDRFEMDHDAAGTLVQLRRVTRGDVRVVYEAKAKKAGLPALLRTIDERLREVVPATLARLTLTEPVFCLALVYELEQGEVLPPRLAIGEAAYRAGFDSAERLWNPAEWRLIDTPALALDDPALLEASRAANQLLVEGGKIEPARKLLATLAAELPASAWAGLPVTDDFCVVALHGADAETMEKDLKALAKRLPADVRAAWKKAGWL